MEEGDDDGCGKVIALNFEWFGDVMKNQIKCYINENMYMVVLHPPNQSTLDADIVVIVTDYICLFGKGFAKFQFVRCIWFVLHFG